MAHCPYCGYWSSAICGCPKGDGMSEKHEALRKAVAELKCKNNGIVENCVELDHTEYVFTPPYQEPSAKGEWDYRCKGCQNLIGNPHDDGCRYLEESPCECGICRAKALL